MSANVSTTPQPGQRLITTEPVSATYEGLDMLLPSGTPLEVIDTDCLPEIYCQIETHMGTLIRVTLSAQSTAPVTGD